VRHPLFYCSAVSSDYKAITFSGNRSEHLY